MQRHQIDWRKIIFIYIFLLFSYTGATHPVRVQFIAPHYVVFNDTVTMDCNHTVPENDLHKIEFVKDGSKILEYVKGRTPPIKTWPRTVKEGILKYPPDGKRIILERVGFEASGKYFCGVSTAKPIYTQESNKVYMQVIVPQTSAPLITFTKAFYVVGDYLEANCTSSPARPLPHLTWLINGNDVDVTKVTQYSFTTDDGMMFAIVNLKIEVSNLHIAENDHLEITCQSTIPGYPMHHGEYADFKQRTVKVNIIPTPENSSSAQNHRQEVSLIAIACILCVIHMSVLL